jgi:hypothetical protein
MTHTFNVPYTLFSCPQFTCFLHILRNIDTASSKKGAAHVPKLGPHKGLCWAIAKSTSKVEMEAKFAELKLVNPGEISVLYISYGAELELSVGHCNSHACIVLLFGLAF